MVVRCPRCGVQIAPTGDPCGSCGFDPSKGYASTSANQNVRIRTNRTQQTRTPTVVEPVAEVVPEPAARRTGLKVGAAVGALAVLVGGVVVAGKMSGGETQVAAEQAKARGTVPISTTTTRIVEHWAPWSPADRSYTIDFPTVPVVEPSRAARANPNISPNSLYAQADLGATSYQLTLEQPAAGFAVSGTPSEILNRTVDAAIKSPTIAEKKRVESAWSNLPSTEFWAEATDSAGGPGEKLHGRVILGEGFRVFMILTIDISGQADFDRFLASFKITGPS